ncbi:hypothetical protein [Mycobacterium branderi]|uniref:Uncharacterized protein n=1 Tax=Mycobacterium branderi TaxID=43348 RepID=A0ABN6B7L6_9MYCO|nr:hypothetical protein [Mycobacterium branderi]MCV7235943.1 hypothetical protein [Mycobacterium branderi]BBZ12618.1 hypothetical protein MBRA_28130 [Mycobacterium branderi]
MSHYSINELYEFAPKVELRASSRLNPLTEEGALNEAEFIDMRLSPQRSRAGVLLDIRGIGFEGSNTALLVLTGVGKAGWTSDDTRQHPWYARRGDWTPTTSVWNKPAQPWTAGSPLWAHDAVDASHVATAAPPIDKPANNKLPEYIVGFGSLAVSALSAQIYLGHVDGLGEAPPDMTELSDAEIIAGFPQWSSIMEVREHYVYPA